MKKVTATRWEVKIEGDKRSIQLFDSNGTAIVEKPALYLYKNGEEYSESSEKILNQSKPYTPKKRYYLLDIEYAEGVYKTNYYINDKGLTINGSRVSGKLLKKHENEFIEV